ncbi:uncharacterized protein PGTG_19292 [Puccinia graminis f. sp. tritici CRL 75-36-700-3]|uniref:Uncharacterized protein n=1 Tax=Puccinia graminis f. sp. tritici (strain CRL 75-36-700-3 / race SCCL) TaxID=418459 RepID=E3L9W2_PUCGT|nr:uncharacterized protein PGTG_19292 [Puccinia graminis f. sp. tritici CRL 75-36-700-3]EFP93337.2 hypothetical protein PGTG_19292 [Puccinia graminis f. sp. tritici CRL 75-36-700-3]
MEDQIAIVIVLSVSITPGHQIGRANPVGPGPSNSSPTHGRKLTKFSPKAPPPQSGTSAIESAKPKLSKFLARRERPRQDEAREDDTPRSLTKGKGKATNVSSTDGEDESDESSDEESEGDVQVTPTPPAKRGRPRRNIIQEAAKRMKKQ